MSVKRGLNLSGVPKFVRVLLLIGGRTMPFAVLISVTVHAIAQAPSQVVADYTGTMRRIADDINELKHEFPQLRDFSVKTCLHDLDIGYSYRTHRSKIRVGWRGSAPEPDRDGIWFHINFHDQNSVAQIDTQPLASRVCFAEKRVTFLLMEGSGAKPLGARLNSILAKNGVEHCHDLRSPR